MNVDTTRPNPHKHEHAQGYVIETGRNQHTLLVEAYCPFCGKRTPQAVYYSFNTAIAHGCRGECRTFVWNETDYSHTTRRHSTMLKAVLGPDVEKVYKTQFFVSMVPQDEQCLLCRTHNRDTVRHTGQQAEYRCDRPARRSCPAWNETVGTATIWRCAAHPDVYVYAGQGCYYCPKCGCAPERMLDPSE